MTTSADSVSVYTEISPSKLMKTINLFLKDEKYCDLNLIRINSSQKIMIHKVLFASASKTFEEMIDCTGTHFFSRLCIELDDSVSKEVFEIFIKFLYTGYFNPPCNILCEIKTFAEIFQIQELLDQCEEMMEKKENKVKTKVNCKKNIMTITKTDRKKTEVWSAHLRHVALFRKLNKFRLEGKYCDFIIKVAQTEIKVHGVILAAASRMCHKLLEDSNVKILNVSDCSIAGIEAVILCLYTGRLWLTPYNVAAIYHTSKVFEIPDITQVCKDYVLDGNEKLTPFVIAKFSEINNQLNMDFSSTTTDSNTENNLSLKLHYLGSDPYLWLQKQTSQDYKLFCLLCSVQFKSEKSGVLHIKNIHMCFLQKDHQEMCDICGQILVKYNCHFHKLYKHNIPLPYEIYKDVLKCKFCGKPFFRQSKYDSHIVLHTNERLFPCTRCGKKFKTKEILRCHLKWTCKDETNSTSAEGTIHPFMCDVCGKHLKTPNTLRRHKVIVHKLKKDFKCPLCSFASTTPYSLQRHLIAHSEERPFKCDECGDYFKTDPILKKHKRRRHSEDYKYNCMQCSYKSKSRDSLRVHQAVHTVERPFPCDICDKSFKIKDALRQHKYWMHQKTKDYKCDQCDYACKTVPNLQNHILTHNNVQRFCCDICGQKFKAKQTHKKHMIKFHNDLKIE